MPLTRRHATAFLGPAGSQAIEELRRAWDPDMARQIAAHVTLIYPEEIPDPAELTARTARAAASTAPFTIAIGSPFYAGSAGEGVFFHVSDPGDGIGRFRAIAVPDARVTGFPPHVTIVHPRTSRRGEQAWAELATMQLDARFVITRVTITAYDGDRWLCLDSIPLIGPAGALPAGAWRGGWSAGG